MAGSCTLRLLGGASIETPAGPVTGRAAQRHRLALLAFLATTPEGSSRDKLVAVLWPERRSTRARHALSDSVYRINKALGSEVVVAVGDRDLRLDGEALPSDLASFHRAVEQERWEEAVELYGGPFLDGFHLPGSVEFEHWLEQQRRRLERDYAHVLESLAEERAEGGDPEGAVDAWRRRAALDPYDSRVAMRLMDALEAAGNPAAALRHARDHAGLLDREYGTAPDPELTALADRIRDRPAARRAPGTRPGPETRPVPDPAEPGDAGEAASLARSEATATAARPRSSEPERAAPGHPWKRTAIAGLAGAAVVAAMWVTTRAALPSAPMADEPGSDRAVADADLRSIAVLAFEDLSPQGDQEWFADGVAEEIVQALSWVEGLRVIALKSAFVFRDRAMDVRRIADSLGVEFVVDGSVRVGGDSVWISARLIDGATGFQRWSDTYATTPSAERLRAAQDRIAREVATSLSLRVADSPEPRGHVPGDSTYEIYLEGRYHLRSFQTGASSDRREVLRSLTHFRQVVEREPRWADGWASLGEAHHWAAFRGYDPDRHRAASKRALERAVMLDPDHPQANASLGYILHRLDRDYDAAQRRFRRALALDSDQYWHCGYTFFLLWSGSYEEAVEATRRAEAHDPMFWPLTALRGLSNRCAGRYEEAIRQAERVLATKPLVGGVRRDLALSLERTGRVEEALARLEEVAEPRDFLDLARALVLARSGRSVEAEAVLSRVDVEEARRWATTQYWSKRVTAEPLHAAALVALGRQDEAIDVLRTAMDRAPDVLLYDRCYPELRSLEGDPRYRELLDRTGVPRTGVVAQRPLRSDAS